jgi:hypothetical protein
MRTPSAADGYVACGKLLGHGSCLRPKDHDGYCNVANIVHYPTRPWNPRPEGYTGDRDAAALFLQHRGDLQRLAPEMAEAILAWFDAMPPTLEPRTDAARQLMETALKLRAIGATDG